MSPNWRCQILLLFPPLHQLIFAEEEEEGRLHLATLSNFVLGCVNLCVAKFRFSGYQLLIATIVGKNCTVASSCQKCVLLLKESIADRISCHTNYSDGNEVIQIWSQAGFPPK